MPSLALFRYTQGWSVDVVRWVVGYCWLGSVSQCPLSPPPQRLPGWEVLDVGRVLRSDSVVGSCPDLFLFQKDYTL